MAMITLQNSSMTEVTVLSNTFIDNYMPEANGEFIKVYIYLLRSLSNAPVSFSLEQMADRLLCTERDILRALKYWAKQELLVLDFTDSDKLCGIALLSPDKHTETASSVSASVETVSTVEQPAVQAASAPSATAEPSVTTGKASSDKKQELTPERIRELKQNEEIIQILYIAEQYLGKTLSPTSKRSTALSSRTCPFVMHFPITARSWHPRTKTSSVLPTGCIRTAAQETTTTQKSSITTDSFPTAKKTVLFRAHT